MGLSSTFYEINKTDFNKIKEEISLFKIHESKSFEILEQNNLGIEFILKKSFDSIHHEIIAQIFNPEEFLGDKPDYNKIKFDEIDFSEIEDKSISFLSPNEISIIDNLLNSISESEIQKKYNSSELNSNGIYPDIWHDDESNDKSFNRRHICEGIKQLKSIFNRAHRKGNYIFVFTGF